MRLHPMPMSVFPYCERSKLHTALTIRTVDASSYEVCLLKALMPSYPLDFDLVVAR